MLIKKVAYMKFCTNINHRRWLRDDKFTADNRIVNGGKRSQCRKCCARRAAEEARKMRLTVLRYYSNGDRKEPSCVCCGEGTLEFLGIDHMNNDGAKHRAESTGNRAGLHTYRWLIRNNFPPGFQTLCWNCNMAKGFYGSCPHQKIK